MILSALRNITLWNYTLSPSFAMITKSPSSAFKRLFISPLTIVIVCSSSLPGNRLASHKDLLATQFCSMVSSSRSRSILMILSCLSPELVCFYDVDDLVRTITIKHHVRELKPPLRVKHFAASNLRLRFPLNSESLSPIPNIEPLSSCRFTCMISEVIMGGR